MRGTLRAALIVCSLQVAVSSMQIAGARWQFANAQSQEFRGVWYTPRSGSNFVSQAQIAAAMDTIRNNNFNTVLFNVWSQGYPLFRSNTFYKATNGWGDTDPKAGNRDLLSEAITEAHRRGLEIEAWFEYGFVGGYSGNKPAGFRRSVLIDAHTNWLGRSSGGIDSVAVGAYAHYWMSNENAEVKKFLRELVLEIADNYDVDGIELDRIRYPTDRQTDWGYDSATVATYVAEKGVNPPSIPSDASWMRWRADKLNAFHKEVYDSVKAHNPNVLVTNAPAHYSNSSYYAAYESYLQDWAAWINDGYLDGAHLQEYVSTASTLNGYINSWKTYRVTDPAKQAKVFPGYAVAPSGTPVGASEFLSMVQTVRNQGLKGHTIWYFDDLNLVDGTKSYWAHLKSGPFSQYVSTPQRQDSTWRPAPILLNNLDPAVVDTIGTWFKLSTATPGYFGRILMAQTGPLASVTYHAAIPYSAFFDIYTYQRLGSTVRSARAPFDLFDSSGTSTRVLVNQQDANVNGWVYLGTRFFRQGTNVTVLRVSNEGIEASSSVVDGGTMLLLNRKLSPVIATSVPEMANDIPSSFLVSEAFPNPFNPTTTIRLSIPQRTDVSMMLYDLLGRGVRVVLERQNFAPGVHDVNIDGNGLSSGTYFLSCIADGQMVTRVLLLLK